MKRAKDKKKAMEMIETHYIHVYDAGVKFLYTARCVSVLPCLLKVLSDWLKLKSYGL